MKSYTDIEQSKKLADILPIESADMRYAPFGDVHPWVWEGEVLETGSIPCWSLSALLNAIPSDYTPILTRGTDYPVETGDWCAYLDNEEVCKFRDSISIADNPIDVCVEMIIKLHKEENL